MYFFFNDTATTEIYTLSLHDALPIFIRGYCGGAGRYVLDLVRLAAVADVSDLLHLRHRGGQAGAVRSAGGGERDRGRVHDRVLRDDVGPDPGCRVRLDEIGRASCRERV